MVKPKSIQMSSLKTKSNKKIHLEKHRQDGEVNSKGSKSTKSSNADSSVNQSSNEKVRLKLNMAGKKNKRNKATKTKKK